MGAGLLELHIRPPGPRAAATRHDPLRQVLLVALCLVWFVPGLVGRSLWNPTETMLVPAAVESFAYGFSPAISSLGEYLPGVAPLYLYLSHFAGIVLEPAFEFHEGMRIFNLFWLVYALALGGVALGQRYGSRVGWRFVLLVMSSLGLLLHARTVNSDVVLLLLGIAGVLGVAWMRSSRLAGGVVLGLVGATFFWCVGMVAIWYVLALSLMSRVMSRGRSPRAWLAGVLATAALSAFGVLAWLVALMEADPALPSAYLAHVVSGLAPVGVLASVQNMILSAAWVTWPALPFATMSYIRWRHGSRQNKEIPDGLLGLGAGFLALVLTGSDRDSAAILLLPAAAYMAVVGMQSLSREVAKIHDWFAIVVIGGGMIGFFWLSWVAVQVGWPAGMVEWLGDLGVKEGARGLPVFFAVVVSLAWVALMLRIGRSSERAVTNWTVGITMSWLLFTLLWMPEVDRAKGYVGIADGIKEVLPADYGCVGYTANVDGELVAQLAYLTNLRFAGGERGGRCPWLLAYADENQRGAVAWTGKRAGDDPSETLSLHNKRRLDDDRAHGLPTAPDYSHAAATAIAGGQGPLRSNSEQLATKQRNLLI